jgi:hypothetical protein
MPELAFLNMPRPGIWNRCNLFSFQLLARHFELAIRFGVPYESRTVAAVKETLRNFIQKTSRHCYRI